MVAYENDKLIIPDEYKRMSVSELEKEEERILREHRSQSHATKQIKENKRKIVFNF